jgi:AraC-like DNA-binding protein
MPAPASQYRALKGAQIGVPGILAIGKARNAVAHPSLPSHVHRGALEICLLVKGRQTFRVGETIYRLKGGDQFVSFPNEEHDTADLPMEKGILHWLILDVRRSQNEFLFLNRKNASILTHQLLQLPRRHFHADPESGRVLERLWGILSRPPSPVSRLQAANEITRYLLQTLVASSEAVPEVSPRIQKSLDFVARRVDEWINVPTLAEQAGLSESLFKARFRLEMGLPPGEYMLRRKIEEAKDRMVKPGESVTCIAHNLGFSSSQYFATVFKRYTHQTPSQFTAQRRGMAGMGSMELVGSQKQY